MKSHKYLYPRIYSIGNLCIAFKNASKGKNMKKDVIEFRHNLKENILSLQKELKEETYLPKSLQTFILRDPKTRKISKSDFKDRVVHHAIVNVIEKIFDKNFIYDSYANRKGKGTLKAIERFDFFKRKVSRNNTRSCFVLKADIKHYFDTANHKILLRILNRRIRDQRVINIIKKILDNHNCGGGGERQIGMPLGNLTSQFFANAYLNELDYFIKQELKVKYYIRYVDDFIILHHSKTQLEIRKVEISKFLKETLKLELHPDKSRIIPLSKGIDFVGFRNFYHYRLLRKRNIKNMINKIECFKNNKLDKEKLLEIYKGWQAYAKWANTYKLTKKIEQQIKNNINSSNDNKS